MEKPNAHQKKTPHPNLKKTFLAQLTTTQQLYLNYSQMIDCQKYGMSSFHKTILHR